MVEFINYRNYAFVNLRLSADKQLVRVFKKTKTKTKKIKTIPINRWPCEDNIVVHDSRQLFCVKMDVLRE